MLALLVGMARSSRNLCLCWRNAFSSSDFPLFSFGWAILSRFFSLKISHEVWFGRWLLFPPPQNSRASCSILEYCPSGLSKFSAKSLWLMLWHKNISLFIGERCQRFTEEQQHIFDTILVTIEVQFFSYHDWEASCHGFNISKFLFGRIWETVSLTFIELKAKALLKENYRKVWNTEGEAQVKLSAYYPSFQRSSLSDLHCLELPYKYSVRLPCFEYQIAYKFHAS